MGKKLQEVRDALANPVEPGMDGIAPEAPEYGALDPGAGFGGEDDGGRFSGPRRMPDDCPVIPVGTESGLFYFITALGELRTLKADQVANKHIIAMFAPDSQYLLETWPRKKLVKTKNDAGEDVEEWIVTGWRNDDVGQLLMDAAATHGVWNARERVRGRGAWRGKDGGLILHTGNHVLINGTWHKPGMHDGMVYPTAPTISKPAHEVLTAAECAPDTLARVRMAGCELADDAPVGQLAQALFGQWNWARPEIDPTFLLGVLMVMRFGGALDYRPLAWITGDTKTGKSTLQTGIGDMMNGAILQSSDATEAAVRQVLGQQTLAVALDEAEASEDNRKMLALVKLARIAASAAGDIMRGGQDHEGHQFQARTCFLFSSILVPPMPPQDKNRLAMLELGELPTGKRWDELNQSEMNAIGAQLLRRIVDRWQYWPRLLALFKDALIDHGGHGGRTAAQFGTLLAAAHMALEDGMPDAQTLQYWGQLLAFKDLSETSDTSNEADRCLQHLGSSLVNLAGHGTPRLVSDWLLQATKRASWGEAAVFVDEERQKAGDMLAKIGMRSVIGAARKAAVLRTNMDDEPESTTKPVPVPGREYVAIASAHQGLARLFEGSRWRDGVWSQAVKRVPGAVPNQRQRIGGQNMAVTLVPVEAIVSHDGDGGGGDEVGVADPRMAFAGDDVAF